MLCEIIATGHSHTKQRNHSQTKPKPIQKGCSNNLRTCQCNFESMSRGASQKTKKKKRKQEKRRQNRKMSGEKPGNSSKNWQMGKCIYKAKVMGPNNEITFNLVNRTEKGLCLAHINQHNDSFNQFYFNL